MAFIAAFCFLATSANPAAAASVATLSSLSLSVGTLDPVFSPGVTSYSVNVPNLTTTMTVTPTATDSGATIKVNGVSVASGGSSKPLDLSVGVNTIEIVVTPTSGLQSTYTIAVTRLKPFLIAPAAATTFYAPLGAPYQTQITASGGLAPYRFELRSGSDNFASLFSVSTDGILSGTATISTTWTISVLATDALGSTSIGSYNMVSLKDGEAFAVSPAEGLLSQGSVGSAYSVRFSVNPGSASDLTPSIASGSLPPGLTISLIGTRLAISGTPTAPGRYTFVVKFSKVDSAIYREYTIAVDPTSDARLSGLNLSAGSLTPTFASGTTSYSVDVPNETTTTTVSPTAVDAGAAIKVNGTPVASGATSGAIPLDVGANAITVAVAASDGVTSETYTVTVNRAAPASTDAALSNLGLSVGSLDPVFASETTRYSVNVPYKTTTMMVTPTATDAGATIKVNGTSVTSGVSSGALALSVGVNTIEIVVTPTSGPPSTYTIAVTRLEDLDLTPAVSTVFTTKVDTPFQTQFTASGGLGPYTYERVSSSLLPASMFSVSADGVLSGTASIAAYWPFSVRATDALGSTVVHSYTLASLKDGEAFGVNVPEGLLSQGSVGAPYGVRFGVSTGVVSSVTPSISSGSLPPGLTITRVGERMAIDGTPTEPGRYTFVVKFSRTDSEIFRQYTILVDPASDASLSDLSLSAGALEPAFVSSTTGYSVDVPNETAATTVTPTARDDGATITVNGSPVTSGGSSGAISLDLGANTITVAVTAEDGVTSETYTVTVNRAAPASTDATLSNLGLSVGSLSPAFASGTTSYSVMVPYLSATMTVTPTATDAGATITVNGTSVTSGGSSGATSLKVGANTISIVVTPRSGPQTTYTVVVTRLALMGMTSSGSSTSNFTGKVGVPVEIQFSGYGGLAPYTYEFVSSTQLPENTLSLSADGVLSGPIPISTYWTFSIRLTDALGDTYLGQYTFAALADDETFTIRPPEGPLPEGHVGVPYQLPLVAMPGGFSDITLSISSGSMPPGLALAGAASRRSIAGTPTAPGSYSFVLKFSKTSGDLYRAYTVLVRSTSDATLSDLSLSAGALEPAFASGTTSYSIDVPNATATTTVTPTATDVGATITVNGTPVSSGSSSGAIDLDVGANTITVVATAEDGVTIETYTVTVNRAAPASTDATLSSLSLSAGALEPAFASSTTSYSIDVPNETATTTVSPTATDAGATITVNGTPVTSGGSSGAIDLDVGANTITVAVTAEDGVTIETYTVTVNRAAPASTDATLSSLSLSAGALEPAFASSTTSYSIDVPNATSTTTVSPTATDAGATIAVNGTPVTSGSSSGAISLDVGANTITVVATAEDGVTIETYTVTVNRAAPASTDATLSSLSLSAGALEPAFASGTTSYSVNVPYLVATMRVTPTATDAGAVITVNGTPVTSGSSSDALDLAVGANTVEIVVTPVSGPTSTYTVIVTRLAALVIAPDLSTVFTGQVGTPYQTQFTVSGGVAPYTFAIFGSSQLPASMFSLSADGVLSGTPTIATTWPFSVLATDALGSTVVGSYSFAALADGEAFTVTPAAGLLPDGSVGSAYTVRFTTRPGVTSDVTPSISSGSLPPGLTFGFAGTRLSIAGTPTAPGRYTFVAKFGRADGDIYREYTIAIDPNSDARLSGLSLSAGALEPAFAPSTTRYSMDVPNETATTTVTPVAANAGATIAVNGAPVASGGSSGGIPLDVGANTITVEVAASDGATSETYTVAINRAAPASTDATLSDLSLSAGALEPAFASSTTSYSIDVPNATSTTTVSPTATDAGATITVNSTPVTSGGSSGAIDLDVGANTITVVATAEDGVTSETYTVTVNRAAPASTDATLSSLSLSAGALEPAFASGTTSYSIDVPNATSTTTVSPTATDAGATITVNGTPVTSGGSSGAIDLDVGANTITVVATAEDGVTIETYTVTVNRAAPASTDATLSSLSLSAGTLEPAFASSTTSYSIDVPNATSTTTVSPTAADEGATITVNGTPVTSGSSSGAISLDVGANTVTVAVTAEDGVTSETYTVTVNRAAPASTDASLSSLNLSAGDLTPAFSASTTSYSVDVPNATSATTVSPTATDAGATITVNGTPVTSGGSSGAIDLDVGANTITVVATAEDGVTIETYTVTVNRAAPASTDAALSSLSLSAGTLEPAFTSSTTSYSIDVPNATSTTTVSPTAADAGTTITVNGTPVRSGSSSGAISLDVGANTITVVATAEDGVTSETYTVVVTRQTASTLVMTPASGSRLPQAMAGEDYSFAITATGGVGAVLFQTVGGALPDGMILNVSTGALSGPLGDNTEGDYSFTIQASDRNGNTATASYQLTVGDRVVTVSDYEITVPEGEAPPNLDLTRGATGGPFLDARIVSVQPRNAGEAKIVDTQYAQASGSTPLQFYLKFIPNPAYSGQARVTFQLTSSLGTSNVGSVTYNLSYDRVVVAAAIDTLVRGFVQTRQNLIASTIKVPGLVERRRMATATSATSSDLSPSYDGLSFNFSTSLSQITAATSAGDRPAGAAAYSAPFNMWIDGTFAVHNREENGNQWGSFGMVSAGADYLVSEKALVGLSFHFDRMTDPTNGDDQITGNGWLAGPYASFEVGSGVYWNASLLYGGSSNSIETDFWDGSFDSRRWLLDSSIDGEWQLDDVTTVTPKLRAVYLNEDVPDYDVQNGIGNLLAVQGFATEQLRVSLGAEITRQFALGDGSLLAPKLGLTGGFAGLDGSGAFGQISAGLSLNTPTAWTVDGGFLFNIEGDGQMAVGAKAGVGVKF
ncbi:hypothetical protein QO014_003087 [Kaistia dalseonensis]|uniref:Autotransporter domain-containing protein n=1 Tax=Kaistia dalseonensis TaxID=410840 RepID=A0ABU0H8Q1_9HYPH|nr:cadherin-like beta sandwich domain-containing protein [Kaistia dalseonensis]MDQ0438692.1 hypothetical protein [Kaistia dalseonensis]